MKLNMDADHEITPQERLNIMTIRTCELDRLLNEIQRWGEPYQKESILIELADRHLLNALEVLKGIKFGRA